MTFVFAVEILTRFAVSFPNWRMFFRSKANCFDLFLAIATLIIQIPPIHNSSVYGWLTIFQIVRVYRVIMAIPVTRDLLVLAVRASLKIDQSLEQRVQYSELDVLLVLDNVLCFHPGVSITPRRYPHR
jgi:Ion transport protein